MKVDLNPVLHFLITMASESWDFEPPWPHFFAKFYAKMIPNFEVEFRSAFQSRCPFAHTGVFNARVI